MKNLKQKLLKGLAIRREQCIEELEAVRKLLNLYKDRIGTVPSNDKKFVFLVKKAKDCLFSRRYGHRGNIIRGYSFVVRLFGWNITKW